MREAIGDAAGLTIKAQLRRATVNLGYGADAWRVREALYCRAGSWSAAALSELRVRTAAWREAETTRAAAGQAPSGIAATSHHAMARRLGAIRTALAELGREVEALDAEVRRLLGIPGQNGSPDA